MRFQKSKKQTPTNSGVGKISGCIGFYSLVREFQLYFPFRIIIVAINPVEAFNDNEYRHFYSSEISDIRFSQINERKTRRIAFYPTIFIRSLE